MVSTTSMNDDNKCSESIAVSYTVPIDASEGLDIDVLRISRSAAGNRRILWIFLTAIVLTSVYRVRSHFTWMSSSSFQHQYIMERLDFQNRIEALEPPSISDNDISRPHSAKHGRLESETSSLVIIVDDDGVPKQSVPVATESKPESPVVITKSASTLHAADALQCRESVINFVINATDVKDECEGLKKAFDKTCSNDGDGSRRRRMRKMTDKLKSRYENHWKIWVWESARSINSILRYIFPTPDHDAFFFSEEEVSGSSWEQSYYLAQNNLDYLVNQELRHKWQIESVQRRAQELLWQSIDLNATTNTSSTPLILKNKTTTPKSTTSLALPTSSQHVSEKVLSEALVLQQGDKVWEKVTNQSNIAAQDAATSSKAISETSAAVSAVLNDPDSIEARTCCASILNVYHENCSTDDEEEISDSRLFFIVLVIALCGMVKSLIRHFKILWLPEAAGCIIVGGTLKF
jgi:hypothetical protein